jgi:nucleotide-binding universal stress UspA family protein
MKVLMATDGSKQGTRALVSACRVLAPSDREIDVVCVVPERGKHHPHHEKLRRRAAHILDITKSALAREGISANTVLHAGSPTRVLIAISPSYDVAVMGAKSHSNGSMAGLGPVTSRVLEHSAGSIMVARETRGDTGVRVLAAIDGSEASLHALEKLAALVDLSSAEVTLLHVVETPWLHAGPDQEWLGFEEDKEEEIDPQAQFEQEFVREGEAVLEDARSRLPVRASVTTLIYQGLPADEVLSEAERGDYDLVVIGASGVIDLKHQMLGSVSSKVAWNAPCSVLVVRATD